MSFTRAAFLFWFYTIDSAISIRLRHAREGALFSYITYHSIYIPHTVGLFRSHAALLQSLWLKFCSKMNQILNKSLIAAFFFSKGDS